MTVANAARHHEVLVIFVDTDAPCSICSTQIPAGTTLVATSNPQAPYRHEVCPKPWQPTVVTGGRRGPRRPMNLGQLHLVTGGAP